METPETIRTSLQAGEWVTSIDFKDAYFHIPIHSQSRKYMRFHLQGGSYQFKALPFGLSTAPMEFTVVAKEVKLMALQKGIRIHQYLDDWLVRASTQHTCLRHTQTLVTLCQELGWLVNKEKSELVPKQVFNFVGYQFDLKEGRVRPTEDRWQTLTDKIRSIMSDPVFQVRQFMSLIGLLTATEKQVHLGRLHMRPIQWHLKNNWRVPESLEKVIPVPKSLHPHLKWWLEESNVLLGQPLHPLKHALQIFTDASKEGWGAHLDEHTARGTWSLPESKLHINHLELKAVFLALKEFQTLVCNSSPRLILFNAISFGEIIYRLYIIFFEYYFLNLKFEAAKFAILYICMLSCVNRKNITRILPKLALISFPFLVGLQVAKPPVRLMCPSIYQHFGFQTLTQRSFRQSI